MIQITKNFNTSELARGYEWESLPVIARNNLIILTKEILQPGRDLLKKPIHLTSVYRSPQHNRSVGGASDSQHVYGTAADCYTPGMTGLEFFEFWIKNFHSKIGGIGLYANENVKGKFVHIDCRKKPDSKTIVSWYFDGDHYLPPGPKMKAIAAKYGVKI